MILDKVNLDTGLTELDKVRIISSLMRKLPDFFHSWEFQTSPQHQILHSQVWKTFLQTVQCKNNFMIDDQSSILLCGSITIWTKTNVWYATPSAGIIVIVDTELEWWPIRTSTIVRSRSIARVSLISENAFLKNWTILNGFPKFTNKFT